MARRCVGLGRFAKANNMSVKRGFKVDADLVCGKKRDYVYLSKTGNTGTWGAKYGKGGCKYGFRYEYLDKKSGNMRTGCRKKGPKLSVSAIKTNLGDKAIIPVYAVKKRGYGQQCMAQRRNKNGRIVCAKWRKI